MYKKVLLLLVSFDVLTRILAMTVYFISGGMNLPLPVLGISGLLAVIGIILLVKFLTKGVSLKEISIYLVLDFLGILFNIVYSRVFILVESTKLIDTLIIGNVLLLLLCPILIYVSIKKSKYISIPEKVIQSAQEVVGNMVSEETLSKVPQPINNNATGEEKDEVPSAEAQQYYAQEDSMSESSQTDEKPKGQNKPKPDKKGNHKKGKKSKKR